jgi:hypothetical protein
VHLSENRQSEVNLRTIPQKLTRISELTDLPFSTAKQPVQKLVGNCRDFTLMLTAILQHQGVPARARAGFGTYFQPDHFEDHWICEVWSTGRGGWVRTDAQLDAFQCEKLGIQFDPLDLPADAFWTGGRAWLACRSGRENPDSFGIFDMRGMDFIRGDLIRDFLALNKVEILPWDGWEIMNQPYDTLTHSDLAYLDHLAELTLGMDETFMLLRAAYQEDPRLCAPSDWVPSFS